MVGQEPDPELWRAHSAIAYRRGDVDTSTLTSRLLRTPSPDAGYLGPVTGLVTAVTLAAVDPWADGRFVWDESSAVTIPIRTSPGPVFPMPGVVRAPQGVIEPRADDAAEDAIGSIRDLTARGEPWHLIGGEGPLVFARAIVGDGPQRRTISVSVDTDTGVGVAMLSGPTNQTLDHLRGTETQVCTTAARWLSESTR